MKTETLDLWTLVRGRPQIDPKDLADAVVAQVAEEPLDYRTRLLVRDSIDALKTHWTTQQVERWLKDCQFNDRIDTISIEAFNEVGFPSIRKRLLAKTDPDTIRQCFRQLGYELGETVQIEVGGGCALILPGYVARFTEGIDVVGDVPEQIRTKAELLDSMEKLHGLHMGHVQPHYFPLGWRDRVHAFGVYNHLQVSLVDVYDVFLSKLFSSRMKDLGDLKVLLPQLDKEVLLERFRRTCMDFISAARLKEIAVKNWYVLFGEKLPS